MHAFIFFPQTMTIHRTAGEGMEPFILLSTITTLSQTFRHLFAVLHLRRDDVFVFFLLLNIVGLNSIISLTKYFISWVRQNFTRSIFYNFSKSNAITYFIASHLFFVFWQQLLSDLFLDIISIIKFTAFINPYFVWFAITFF